MINYFLKILIIFIFFNINFANSTQELDRIVAIVNKNVITYNDLTGGINKALLFFEQNSIEPPDENVIKKKVLDELIEQKIVEGYAQDWNIKVSKEDIDSLIDNILKQNEITLEELKSNLIEKNTKKLKIGK